jgi:hypothetical protein
MIASIAAIAAAIVVIAAEQVERCLRLPVSMIATIVERELKSGSAIVVANNRYDRRS